MSRFAFKLPDLGEGTVEAELVAWHVAAGEHVREGQPIAEVSTEKAVVDVPSPVDGTVHSLHAAAGQKVAVGSDLVTFLLADEATAVATPPAATIPRATPTPTPAAAGETVRTSPSIRRRAREAGIDLENVSATGPDGRVTQADFDRALRADKTPRAATARAPAVPAVAVPDVEEVPMTGVRRIIAERMSLSKRTIPHFSYVEECDVTALEAMRGQLNEARGDRPRLTMLPLLVVAICSMLAFTLPVALKIFSPEPFADARSYDLSMARIARVAARVAQIQQDNLLDVHNFLDRNRIRIMEMEWVDGYDLSRLLTREMFEQARARVSQRRWDYLNDVVVTNGQAQPRLKPGIAMAITRECLAALAALHREAIVHGDIKPANIMLKRTGNAKIVDIGSAFEITDPPTTRTVTPQYAAPEVLEGTACTPRSDLASLGYVLIELLSGRQPFVDITDYHALLEAKRSGKLDDTEAVRKALKTAKWDSVRGPFRFNTNQYPIQNYIVRTIGNDGHGGLINKSIGEPILKDHGDAYVQGCPMK